MSISRQNLTIIIVTFKSENVIHQCIQSIGSDIQIIIVDNSNDNEFKHSIEKKYKNVSCLLSKHNLGMGAGNNLGIANVKTDFAFILNPDVILEKNAIDELILASRDLDSFGLLAPINIDQNYPNYKKNNKNDSFDEKPNEAKSVDGYAMVLNLKRLNLIRDFNYFDENFFMYLENDDLCMRIKNENEKIFVIPKSKIHHLGGKAVNENFKDEIELSRNWHWIWSKFYFNKKHKSFLFALVSGLPSFLSALSKFLFYFFSSNKMKKNIYLNRMNGFIAAFLGKPAFYRPKIKN
tara:strand:- start:1313 stop:2191 length:879 start_codon:yes stop_codon:yes gene_type:complete